MSLEQSLDKLTAALEAATGVLVTMTANKPAAAQTPATTPTEPAKKRGRPAAAKEPEPEPDEFGDELGGDDDLGGDDTPTVSAEDAKAAVFAYRDKAMAALGDKELALGATRKILKSVVASVDAITDENAPAVYKAFTEAPAPKKGK